MEEQIRIPSLQYSVEWRPYLWLRPLQYVLGDPARFAGQRVLDLGCRFGKMACWFAAHGAIVKGMDISPEAIEIALAERSKWKISEDLLSFDLYDGNLAALPQQHYDFVFTKSVLIIMNPPSDVLAAIAALLKPGGEYLAVENAAAGFPVSLLRRRIHRRWKFEENFHGIDSAFIGHFRRIFPKVSYKKFWGLVYAIQASIE